MEGKLDVSWIGRTYLHQPETNIRPEKCPEIYFISSCEEFSLRKINFEHQSSCWHIFGWKQSLKIHFQHGLRSYRTWTRSKDEWIGQISPHCSLWYDQLSALLGNVETVQSNLRLNFSMLSERLPCLCLTNQPSSSHRFVYACWTRL